MPVSRLDDLPVGGDGRWPLCGRGFRSAQWGDMEVGYTTTGAGDHTALYQGLAGGVCPCPALRVRLQGPNPLQISGYGLAR